MVRLNDTWINLYSDTGRLQGRYNPRTQQLVIAEHKVYKTHDLGKYHRAMDNTQTEARQVAESMLG